MTNKRARVRQEDDALAAALHELRLSGDAAGLRVLVHLCRRSDRVRRWITSRIGSDETRRRFTAFLDGNTDDIALWGAAVGAEVVSDPSPTKEETGPHGGLSQVQVWRLIKECQGSDANTALFLVTQTWHAVLAEGRPVPAALWLPTLECWHEMVADRSARKAQAFVKMLKLLDGRSTPAGDSWHIRVLLYILQHPQPRYRVGELLNSLPERFRRTRANGNLYVERREVRKFCDKCGIERDKTPGAPKRPRA